MFKNPAIDWPGSQFRHGVEVASTQFSLQSNTSAFPVILILKTK
jgi:hypothetical protein